MGSTRSWLVLARCKGVLEMVAAVATKKRTSKRAVKKSSPRGQGVRFQKIEQAVDRGQDVILADASYPLAVFCKRTGMGADAVREHRRQGLKVRRAGNYLFVLGKDWLEFLGTLGG